MNDQRTARVKLIRRDSSGESLRIRAFPSVPCECSVYESVLCESAVDLAVLSEFEEMIEDLKVSVGSGTRSIANSLISDSGFQARTQCSSDCFGCRIECRIESLDSSAEVSAEWVRPNPSA